MKNTATWKPRAPLTVCRFSSSSRITVRAQGQWLAGALFSSSRSDEFLFCCWLTRHLFSVQPMGDKASATARSLTSWVFAAGAVPVRVRAPLLCALDQMRRNFAHLIRKEALPLEPPPPVPAAWSQFITPPLPRALHNERTRCHWEARPRVTAASCERYPER